MAKQAGDIKIVGTIDELCFYKMDGEYYVRLKSSLTGNKFWKHKAFEGSRKSCSRFGEGNKLASKLYGMIEKEKREYKLYCFLKRRAIALFKEEKSSAETEAILESYLVDFGLLDQKESNKEVTHSNNLTEKWPGNEKEKADIRRTFRKTKGQANFSLLLSTIARKAVAAPIILSRLKIKRTDNKIPDCNRSIADETIRLSLRITEI